jgi:hypothetical protein
MLSLLFPTTQRNGMHVVMDRVSTVSLISQIVWSKRSPSLATIKSNTRNLFEIILSHVIPTRGGTVAPSCRQPKAP